LSVNLVFVKTARNGHVMVVEIVVVLVLVLVVVVVVVVVKIVAASSMNIGSLCNFSSVLNLSNQP